MVNIGAIHQGDAVGIVAGDDDGVLVMRDSGGDVIRGSVFDGGAIPDKEDDPGDDGTTGSKLSPELLKGHAVECPSGDAVGAQEGGNRIGMNSIGIRRDLPLSTPKLADKADIGIITFWQLIQEFIFINRVAEEIRPIDRGASFAIE